jgi:hypothetical protein
VGDKEEEYRREKLKLTGGDHRLAQVLVKPEVFSIHMKRLKIWAQEPEAVGNDHESEEVFNGCDQLIWNF